MKRNGMRTKPFVMVYREVAQDGRLSLEARGLFMLMISLPDSWRYTVAGLAKMAGCGRGRLRRMLEELERLFCPNGAEVEMCPHFRLIFSGNRGKITRLQRKTWKEDVYVHHC